MKRASILTPISIFLLIMVLCTNAWSAAPCNEDFTVGGGTLAVSPSSGAGWDVGGGQCNGSFTVTEIESFPADGEDGIELGLRAEQRRVGQVINTSNNGVYEVGTGPDPTQANRAWWNFQHSIAYDGNIVI